MKRALSLLLVLVLVVGMLPTVYAAENPTVSMTADQTNIKAGETVTLTISIDQAVENLMVFEYYIIFNADLFTKTAHTIGDAYGPAQVGDQSAKTGMAHVAVNGIDTAGDPFTLNAGTIASVTFTAKEDITEDVDTAFALEFVSTMDYDTFADHTVVMPEDISVSVAVPTGYTVALSPAEQSKVSGETAQVSIDVTHSDAATFNSFDISLSYNPAKLTLATDGLGNEKYTIVDNNGTVRIQGYGEDVAVGTAFTLDFTVITDAEVTLTAAKVDVKDNAVNDAPEAILGNAVAAIKLGAYSVSLPEDFRGEDTAAAGEDYTFEAKDKNYDYVVEATMGGEDVEVIDNGDGTYTIENVSGDIVITATKTPKTFNVTIEGEDTTGAETATYLTDYVFTVDHQSGYSYEVSVTIGGVAYTGYTVADGSYTIDGADITGDIVITVTRTALPDNTVAVTIEGNGAGDVTGESTATKGEDYTFTVDKEDGFEYEIVVMVGDTAVEYVDNGDGSYTIPGEYVTDTITITVTKESTTLKVAVDEYVKLDGKVIYLVTASLESLEDGKVLAYDSNVMTWSDEYEAYAYLVISDTELTVEAATALVSQLTATADTVSYDGDVNGSKLIDINDAQLVYNMYNGAYDNFDTAAMAMFLRADMNGDKTLNVTDSAAIVSLIA